MIYRISFIFAVPAIIAATISTAQANLINGGFESPVIADNSYAYLSEGTPGLGWQTTASDNKIELWNAQFNGVDAYEGDQFAELNATQVSDLYQEVSGITAGSILRWEFAHRGRQGDDTIALQITDLGNDNIFGGGNDNVLYYGEFTDGVTDWGFHWGTGLVALGNNLRFSWLSISTAPGVDPNTYGNFLDAAAFGVDDNPPIPEPATILLFGAGIAGLAGMRLRKK